MRLFLNICVLLFVALLGSAVLGLLLTSTVGALEFPRAWLIVYVGVAVLVIYGVSRLLSREMNTLLKISESKYLEEKTKLETLIHNLPDGIVIANLKGEVLYLNSPAMEILGVRSASDGKPVGGLIEILRHPELREIVNKITEKHARSQVVEIDVPGPKGPVKRYFHTTVTLYSLSHGKDHGILLLLRDVTADRQITQMKEDFFHAVAHDLRAPIFAVQGYIRLLEKAVDKDEKNQSYFSSIYQSCEKLMLFIQDLLDSSRLEAGQLKIAPASILFEVFLQRIHKLFSAIMEEKGIRFSVRLAPDVPERVEIDPRLLERAIHNLVANALKFTPRGGEIRIEAARAGSGEVEVTVADTGPGIPEDKRSLIFEKFAQLETKNEKTGYGLGLHICRQIVEIHKGKIWLNSDAGKGSQFTFRIPIKH